MKEYELNNGWVVTESSGGQAILHVTPLPNSLFRVRQEIEIPSEIFTDIKSGERSVTELFRKFRLHDLILQWGNRKPEKKAVNDLGDNHYRGQDFIASQLGDSFFLEFERSSHGGGQIKMNVTREIFEYSIKSEVSIHEIIKRFKLKDEFENKG